MTLDSLYFGFTISSAIVIIGVALEEILLPRKIARLVCFWFQNGTRETGKLIHRHWMKVAEGVGFILLIIGLFGELKFESSIETENSSVAKSQQDKIISLEEYIRGRVLTKEQFDSLLELKGRIPSIMLLPEDHCAECFNFANQFLVAFDKAEMKVFLAFPEIHGSGDICVYQAAPYSELLESKLNAIGIRAHLCPLLPPRFPVSSIPSDTALMSIPSAPPFGSEKR